MWVGFQAVERLHYAWYSHGVDSKSLTFCAVQHSGILWNGKHQLVDVAREGRVSAGVVDISGAKSGPGGGGARERERGENDLLAVEGVRPRRATQPRRNSNKCVHKTLEATIIIMTSGRQKAHQGYTRGGWVGTVRGRKDERACMCLELT